jgi:hypothetical protein
MALSNAYITELASRPGAKEGAVKNFLFSMQSARSTEWEASMNLTYDAKSYRWSKETVAAIKAGIKKHFK